VACSTERSAGIYEVTIDEERSALEHFVRHHDKAYSFVDCVSFVVMDKLGVSPEPLVGPAVPAPGNATRGVAQLDAGGPGRQRPSSRA
jgi:hypothetical protein